MKKRTLFSVASLLTLCAVAMLSYGSEISSLTESNVKTVAEEEYASEDGTVRCYTSTRDCSVGGGTVRKAKQVNISVN